MSRCAFLLVTARSSPPSPVFDLPPMRFIATAKVECASVEIEPKLIAPVAKRLTISVAGSTSSSQSLCSDHFEFKQTAQSHVAFGLIVDDLRVFFVGLVVVFAAGGLFAISAIASGVHICSSLRLRHAYSPPVANFLANLACLKGFGMHGNGFLRRFKQTQTADIGRCALKYLSTSSCFKPTASKICEPV